jgi:hypothetical protein
VKHRILTWLRFSPRGVAKVSPIRGLDRDTMFHPSFRSLVTAVASLSCALAFADEKPAVKPHPVTLTFFIAGTECSACMDSVRQAVSGLKSVTDFQPEDLGVVNISFDTHVTSAHQQG